MRYRLAQSARHYGIEGEETKSPSLGNQALLVPLFVSFYRRPPRSVSRFVYKSTDSGRQHVSAKKSQLEQVTATEESGDRHIERRIARQRRDDAVERRNRTVQIVLEPVADSPSQRDVVGPPGAKALLDGRYDRGREACIVTKAESERYRKREGRHDEERSHGWKIPHYEPQDHDRRHRRYPRVQFHAMQSVIFDMDGVIVDSEPTHFRLERELFHRLGLVIDDAEHERYVGTNARGMLEEIARRHGAAWERHGMTIDDVVEDEYRRYQEQLIAGAVPFVSGAVEVIRDLSRAGWKLAIASSAPHSQIDEVVRQAELDDIVECRISGDDVERSKPDPAIFLRTAACLGSAPSECWVVEDSENGVRAAVAAGMVCIGFRNGSSGRQNVSAAAYVADTMPEVARILAI